MTSATVELAEQLLAAVAAVGGSIATAESLTGGLVADALVTVPGASAVYRGGVVCYDTALKRDLLGVDARLLAERGPVDPDVAAQMAERARVCATIDGLPASLGLASTGVAGPEPLGAHSVGEVYLAVATERETRVERCVFEGDRASIRQQAAATLLQLALDTLA